MAYLLDNGAKERDKLGLKGDDIDDNALGDSTEKATNIADERSSGC